MSLLAWSQGLFFRRLVTTPRALFHTSSPTHLTTTPTPNFTTSPAPNFTTTTPTHGSSRKPKVASKDLTKSGKKKSAASIAASQYGRPTVRRERSPVWSRIHILRQNLFIRAPPPLRMGRLRHLRHWTIHRAWQLYRRQIKDDFETERAHIRDGMYHACEELRRTVWPNVTDEGYLYRVSQEKKRVWKIPSVVPIEYARIQTESPPRKVWNHEWEP